MMVKFGGNASGRGKVESHVLGRVGRFPFKQLTLGVVAGACLVGAQLPQPHRHGRAAERPVEHAQARLPAPLLRTPVISSAEVSARRVLDASIHTLGRAFSGHVGLAVRDLQTGWTSSYNGSTLFPQQSVSKFWVALTALDKVDRGQLDLNRPVVVRREDLTLFHQPIAALVKGNGYTTTLGDLLYRAITQSDNTANDFVLRRAGGPDAVRAFLRNNQISSVRFGPGERLLQSHTAGLTWRQEYSIGNRFTAARSSLPTEVRRAAFERYVADPIDGASPLGLIDGLAKLHRGELLSPESTRRLLTTMANTRTGARRLKGGLAPGWSVAHKTGTGQVFGSAVAGFNDVGIVTAPDGRAYAVAVLIGRTTRGIPERQRLMNDAVRTIIAYHNNIHRY
jgi:beta-lactamase class A